LNQNENSIEEGGERVHASRGRALFNIDGRREGTVWGGGSKTREGPRGRQFTLTRESFATPLRKRNSLFLKDRPARRWEGPILKVDQT